LANYLQIENPPFIPGFLRRNEVAIQVEYLVIKQKFHDMVAKK